MKKILSVLLAFCGVSVASVNTALKNSEEDATKHYKVGERIVIPIPLENFPNGAPPFECLEADGKPRGANYQTDFIAKPVFKSGSSVMSFTVSQCQKVGRKDSEGKLIYKENGDLDIDNNDWHNTKQNKWIEVVAESFTPGTYEGTITIKGSLRSPNSGNLVEVETVPVGFKFVVSNAETLNPQHGLAVLFADSSASYDMQIDINTIIKNVSNTPVTIKKNSYIDYYLKSTTTKKPLVDIWYNQLGDNAACVQVYKCENNNYLIREYILNDMNESSITMPQVGYRETNIIKGDKQEGGADYRDYSYTVPSISYETKARNRNLHFENKIAMYSEGVRIWGQTPNWLGSCQLAKSSEVTMNGSGFCNETPMEIVETPDGVDEIFEGEDYFFMTNLTSLMGVEVRFEPVAGALNPSNWLEIGTAANYWDDYANVNNNNVNTLANQKKIYVRSKHGMVRQRDNVVPGTYKYKVVITDPKSSAVKTSFIRTIVVKEGSSYQPLNNNSVAVLMGDETWFKPYQLDIATGIVNYGNENVNLSHFRYEYYGQVEDANADLTKAKYQPHDWYSGNGDLNVTFADCGNGRFRVRYRYNYDVLIPPNHSSFDFKTGFVYGSTVQMNKMDDFSLGTFEEDPPRRRYNPNMPLFDKDNNLLWGKLPAWANQCEDYIAPINSSSSFEPPIPSSSSYSSSSSYTPPQPQSSSSSYPRSSSSMPNFIARLSSSSSFNAFRDLAVRFKAVDATQVNRRKFKIDVINKGNKAAQIGGYTARFYYNDETVPDTAKLKFDGTRGQYISDVMWEQCEEHLFAANFKFASNVSIEPNQSSPRDGAEGNFYLENVNDDQGNILDVGSFKSWIENATTMTENKDMALFDSHKNLVYGREAWPCNGYKKKTLKLIAKGRAWMVEKHFRTINKNVSNSAARVAISVENHGDSVLTGPVFVDYQVTHTAGMVPVIEVWGKILGASGVPMAIDNEQKMWVVRKSAGNKHTFRFTFMDGIGANRSKDLDIDFLLYDQCADDCKDEFEIGSYLWKLSDDWSAKGTIKSGSGDKIVTNNITVYNSDDKLLYGEADPSSPVYAVSKQNSGAGNGDKEALKHNRPVIGSIVPNRTDAVAYSGGQLLSGGDFESQWVQGWDVYEPDTLRVVKSVRGRTPQGSRYLSMDAGDSIYQKISGSAAQILADSGAVLTIWHKNGSADVKLNGTLIATLGDTSKWVVDTIPLMKTNFSSKNDYVISITAMSGTINLDDIILVPNHEAQPTTYATRFTNTAGEELETRAYDGNKEQLVTTSERDAMGRLWKKYLPFAMDCDGVDDCNSNLKTLHNPSMALNFYTDLNPDYPNAEKVPYVQTDWKPDPMATKDVEGAPGAAFSIDSGHVVKAFSSGVNLSGINLRDSVSLNSAVKAVYNVRKYDSKANYHAAKDTDPTHLWELNLDQNGNAAFTVKDGEGHVIVSGALKKASDNSYVLATRSVNELDERGNVTKSHPPMSCEYTNAPTNCVDPSTYVYDSQSRVIKTVEPDAGTTLTYYDPAGRVRATQTQNQIDSGKVSIVGYDRLDRTVYTGEWKTDRDSVKLRAFFSSLDSIDYLDVDSLTPGTVTRTFYDRMPARDILGVELYPQGIVPDPTYTRGRVAAVISDVRAVVDENGDTLKTSDGKDSVIRVSSANSYDKYGRVIASYAYDPTLPDSLKQLWTTTEYDVGGKVLSTTKYPYGYSLGSITSRTVTERYTYDRLGRVSYIDSKNGTAPLVELAHYEYYPTGSVKTVTLGNSLTISYTYHISGAIKTAEVRSADNRELYADTLYYEDCGNNACTPQYNGNISRMAHHLAHGNSNYGEFRDVRYTYDELNRLINVNDSKQDVFDEIFAYDAQGRIVAQRRDTSIAKNIGGEYAYYANTNRLKSVANGMGGTADERKMSDTANFVYDSEGNLTEDKSKGLKISYDWRGMPVEFRLEPTGSSDNSLFRLTMAYDGSGRRISKTRWVKKLGSQEWEKELVTHYTGIGTEVRENYAGPAKQTKVVVNMPNGLGRYGIEDAGSPDNGSVTGDIPNAKFEWYLKNHLGSTMLVYGTQADANPAHSDIGTPLAAYDYRAFGEMVELTPPSTGKVTENFTGKEHDDEIALDYFGARYLDPMLGLWISVDPARQFASPYLYAGNGVNPVNGVDSDGNVFVDDAGKALYQKAVNNNFWGNKDIENAYRYANETTTEISIEHKGIIRNGPKETLAGVTIPGILDRIAVFFGFADNNYTLGSATVKLSETGTNNWADALGISSDEAEARIAAHEFEAHIHNFTPYSDNLGNDPVDIEHDKIKEIDNRLFPEDN